MKKIVIMMLLVVMLVVAVSAVHAGKLDLTDPAVYECSVLYPDGGKDYIICIKENGLRGSNGGSNSSG